MRTERDDRRIDDGRDILGVGCGCGAFGETHSTSRLPDGWTYCISDEDDEGVTFVCPACNRRTKNDLVG